MREYQTHKHSFLEACGNTAIGLCINIVAQRVVFPWFGIDITISDNLAIAAIFTVISIARGYIVRRFFERGLA